MTRHWCRLASYFLVTILATSLGCAHKQTRAQAEDDHERDRYDVEVVGDFIDGITNADPIPVSGIGLVTNLQGTGSDGPQGEYRVMLKEDLQKHLRNIPELKTLYKTAEEVLSDPSNSLVLVSALIPAGARKGDPIDVEVSLPAGSKTTSLRGGYLLECQLYDYNTTKTLDPKYSGANSAILGHVRAKAKGPVLVGLGPNDEGKLKQGRIWGGGHCNFDRPFLFTLDSKHQQVRIAMSAADRINETFNGPMRSAGTGAIASAKNNVVVEVTAPHQYKHNLPRFLRVARLVPLREGKNSKKKEDLSPDQAPGAIYRRQLEEDLLDPAHCVTAALRLEALGSESIPALKHGLHCKDHVLVRFCAAEALAYLDCPAAGEELAEIVKNHWALRSYALTALASLDEAVSRIRLRDLVTEAAPETRYGAFRALRALDDHDALVQGELLNNSYWLHRVAPETPGMVHFSTTRRAEIVLFGQEAYLKAPFWFTTGDFTVTSGEGDTRCTITRRALHERGQMCQCSLKLDELLHTLAQLGGQYPEAVEILQQADHCRCLSCPVFVDALPQAVSVHELASAGRNPQKTGDLLDAGADLSSELRTPDAEILQAGSELGATPNLLDKNGSFRTRTALERDEDASQRDRKQK